MSKSENTENTTDCQPLLELATPLIYRTNLFRILNLSVNATAKEVQRQQARQKMEAKLGVATSAGARGPLAIDPPPSELETRTAMERLNRPIDRMLDEVFWFWPLGGAGEDEALKLLYTGDAGRARELWRREPENFIAVHNLAVLDHLSALDFEISAMEAPLNGRARERERVAKLWAATLPRWRKVFESEEFSAALKARVRELNDDQLTSGFARRLASSLPFALLLINAKLACAAAERGDKPTADRQLALLQEAKFAEGLAGQVLKEAVKPLRNRIKTSADNARIRWKKAGQRGDQFVRELAEQGGKLLGIVDILLPKSDPARVAMHDIIVEAMMEGQIAYGRKTDDWNGSIKLLELALTLQPGEAVKARLFETIEVLKTNAKSGGDWVSEGYWDLPAEAIEQLEAAREKSRAFDHEGALALLSCVDMRYGAPLKRCVAYTLRGKSIQIFNKGIGTYNEQTPYRQALWDKLVAMSELERRLALMREPSPHASAYLNPNCINCGSSYYTSWYNFTIRTVPLWWCASCQNTHISQYEDQKRAFRPAITTALEYMLLAEETTPKKDATISDDVTHFKKMAAELGASIPDTKGLRTRLSTSSMRGSLLVLDTSPLDSACAFCDGASNDLAASITVPMCGDVQSVEMMFGTGVEFHHAEVRVPRCRKCCTEHREFPERLSRWVAARSAAQSDEHFPLQAAALKSAGTALAAANSSYGAAETVKTGLEADLKAAAAIGAECEGCKSAKLWKNGLCQTCDAKVFNLSPLTIFGLFVLGVGGFMTQAFAADQGDILFRVFSLIFYGVPIVLLIRHHLKKKKELSAKRLAEFETRRAEAVKNVTAKLDAATLKLGETYTRLQDAVARRKEADDSLNVSKNKAAKAFELTFQKPTLINGTRDEATFIEFEPIQRLRTRGWAFGSTLNPQTQIGAAAPVDVKGIVGPKPQAPIEKATLAPVKLIRITPPALKSL